MNRLRLISTEAGAKATLHCALSSAVAGEIGLYYSDDGRPTLPSAAGQDMALAGQLWRRSDRWLRWDLFPAALGVRIQPIPAADAAAA